MADNNALIKAMMIQRLKAAKPIRKFIPTGLMESMIKAVGEAYGQYDIVLAQMPNKVGKTRHAVEIAKNIFWPNDKDYFDYPMYNEFPFRNADGSVIKSARIISDPLHVGEAGAIREEIIRCWPNGKYEEDKLGKHYVSKYTADTGWVCDVLTYEQDPKEFESKLLSFQWLDEPADPKIMGAVMSRMSKGGIVLMTFTPVNRYAGAILDVLDDMEANGTRIKRLYGEIEDNSSETGIMNSKGTKRGLMTNAEIEEYIKKIPMAEREQRLKGKATHKSGKVYDNFNRCVHVKDIPFDSDYMKSANFFMVQDPHPRGYPFMLWVALLSDETYHVWNEWPTYDELGKFYDEARHTDICTYSPSTIADIIKIYDGCSFGFKRPERFIDPLYAQGSKNTWDKKSDGIVAEYVKYGVTFNLPPVQAIGQQRMRLQELLRHDVAGGMPPMITIAPHCLNFIRCMERHYWEDGPGEMESERYKDPIDCMRYILAGIGERKYRPPDELPKPRHASTDTKYEKPKTYADEMKGVEW